MPKKDNWLRGYFCCLAIAIKSDCAEGVTQPIHDELFTGGGDWRKADPEDVETFVRHQLITREQATAAGFTIPAS
jgi:hypothetical protein